MKHSIILCLILLTSTLNAQEKFGLLNNITPPNEKGYILRKYKQCNDLSVKVFFDMNFIDSICSKSSISKSNIQYFVEYGIDGHFNNSIFLIPLIDTNNCYNYFGYSIRKKMLQQLTFFNPINDSILPSFYKEYYKNKPILHIERDYLSGHILELNDTSIILYADYKYINESIGTTLMLFRIDSNYRISLKRQIYLHDVSPCLINNREQAVPYLNSQYRIRMEKTSNSFNYWWLFSFMIFKNAPEKWNRSVDNVYMYTLDADLNIIKIEELDE